MEGGGGGKRLLEPPYIGERPFGSEGGTTVRGRSREKIVQSTD